MFGRYHTIEFRLFNGTLHAGKIKAYVQLALALRTKAMAAKGVAVPAGAVVDDVWVEAIRVLGLPGMVAWLGFSAARAISKLGAVGIPVRVTFDAASVGAARRAWSKAAPGTHDRDTDP